jgi:hypothetical protein
MNIKDKYCLLSELTQAQIGKLRELMPDTLHFDFNKFELLIGFYGEDAGTWNYDLADEIITYKEMLSLLGAKEEEKLVPHVHQKEIIAWANGEEIEIFIVGLTSNVWVSRPSPMWDVASSYRVKPKLTPTQLRIQEVVAELHALHEQDAVERGIDKVMGN